MRVDLLLSTLLLSFALLACPGATPPRGTLPDANTTAEQPPAADGGDAATTGASGDAATATGSSDAAAASDSGAPACKMACPENEHCELLQVMCIRAPCPPLPQCVANEADSGAPSQQGPVVCDPRKVLCKHVAPQCPDWQVPSVVDGCYGDCVPLGNCVCTEAADCPAPDIGTCHMSAGRCGPYV